MDGPSLHAHNETAIPSANGMTSRRRPGDRGERIDLFKAAEPGAEIPELFLEIGIPTGQNSASEKRRLDEDRMQNMDHCVRVVRWSKSLTFLGNPGFLSPLAGA
jgi:hypothetical protein